MKIRYTPQRSDRKVDYKLAGTALQIIEGEAIADVDLNNLPEQHDYPIDNVDEDSVTVIRFYSKEERHLFES